MSTCSIFRALLCILMCFFVDGKTINCTSGGCSSSPSSCSNEDCIINCLASGACGGFIDMFSNRHNPTTVNCVAVGSCTNLRLTGFGTTIGDVTAQVTVNCNVGACTGFALIRQIPKAVDLRFNVANGVSSGPSTVTCGPGDSSSYQDCRATCGEFCQASCDTNFNGFTCGANPLTVTCSGGAGPCSCTPAASCSSVTIVTQQPTYSPSFPPTNAPIIAPSPGPSSSPSMVPSNAPTVLPSVAPTMTPTFNPSANPTFGPSSLPTLSPTSVPTAGPSESPTDVPSFSPSLVPTNGPSSSPSQIPSFSPSLVPSSTPSHSPSSVPSFVPSVLPSFGPSSSPSSPPSNAPSTSPSTVPSEVPSILPTNGPSVSPSSIPSGVPSVQPTFGPTLTPSSIPSHNPSAVPSSGPSSVPSFVPSASPSSVPTNSPVTAPTTAPTLSPSSVPSRSPSKIPSSSPSSSPSTVPSVVPSLQPTIAPTTNPSTVPTLAPSNIPSNPPSLIPSHTPTDTPSIVPTLSPTTVPSDAPSISPTDSPSHVPSVSPSAVPTSAPTKNPSKNPTRNPTLNPTLTPTFAPVISLVEGNYSGGGILVNVTSSQAPITVQDTRRTRRATIQLTDAIELDANGVAVPGQQVNLAQGTWFERLNVNFTDYGGAVSLVDRLEYITMAVLQNQRIRVDMTVSFFKERVPSVIPCPGCAPLPVVGNAFKWSLKIHSWPFASSNHTLQIKMLVIGSHPVNYTQTSLNGSSEATEITLGTVAIFSVAHRYVVIPPGNMTKSVTISTRTQTQATKETQAILSFNFSNFGTASAVYDPLTEVLSEPIVQKTSQGSTSQSKCTIIGIDCILFIIIVVILALLIIICLVCLLCRRRKSPEVAATEENLVDDEGNPVGESVTRPATATTKGGVVSVKSMSTESGPSVEMQSQTLGTPQGRAVSEESVDIAETEPDTAAPARGTSLPKNRVNSESNDETIGMAAPVTIKSESDEDEKEIVKQSSPRKFAPGYQKISEEDHRPRKATVGGGIGGGNVSMLLTGWWYIDSQRRHVVFHSNHQMNVYGNQDANTLISVLDFSQNVSYEADIDNKTVVIHTLDGTRVFKSDQRANAKEMVDILEQIVAQQAGDDYDI